MKKIASIVILFILTSCYSQTKEKKGAPTPLIPKEDYSSYLKKVITKRNQFQKVYKSVDSKKKKVLIIEARQYLIKTISQGVFPYWYGTEWDFNGMTKIPRKGKIACGYFITTILEDIGFNIPRIKWAQSASEVFIKKLAPNTIKRFTNTSIQDIEQYLLKSGDGLYIVGLDNHTGYILVNNKIAKFIHSSYYQPEIGVMAEDIDTWNPLRDSNYRIIGKLMSDNMIKHWINYSTF
jgi:hypothetical protein